MSAAGRRGILLLTSWFYPIVGGVETQVEILARTLASRGEQIDILTGSVSGRVGREERSGFSVCRAIRIVPFRGLWGVSCFLSTLWFLLRRGRRYRLVLCYQMQSFHNPAAILWGLLFRRPVLIVGGGSGESSDFKTLRGMTSGAWLLLSLQKATVYVAISRVMEEEFVAAGLLPEKIRLIQNGVDIHFFHPPPADLRRRKGLVFVGRLDPQKGLACLLEAFSLLVSRRPELTLRILGGGPEEKSLRSQAENLGVDGKVIFEGIREAADVKEALEGAAAVVQPSIAEGLSCSLLEAMAMECPIVTTDIPANRQLIDDGETGRLVPPREVRALADAIDGLLDDPEGAVRMGRAARRRVEEEYSVEAMATRYADLFRRVTAEAV